MSVAAAASSKEGPAASAVCCRLYTCSSSSAGARLNVKKRFLSLFFFFICAISSCACRGWTCHLLRANFQPAVGAFMHINILCCSSCAHISNKLKRFLKIIMNNNIFSYYYKRTCIVQHALHINQIVAELIYL